jgi:hypothetical protein
VKQAIDGPDGEPYTQEMGSSHAIRRPPRNTASARLLAGLLVAAVGPLGAAVSQPVLEWSHGGCHPTWCETGWYASPAVADLDGDGEPEVVASAYSVVSLDGTTGALEWRVASGHDRDEPAAPNVGRTWPGIVIADVDGDGLPEIATAHGGGWVTLYDHLGYFEAGWPQQPTSAELRGLAVADLEGDDTLELIVTRAGGGADNVWILEHTGTLRPGWPRVGAGPGYAAGVYNANAAVADLDGDGERELVVPSDVHYVCAYQPDGTPIDAAAVYGDKVWGQVGVWEDPAVEERGWGTCDPLDARSERYRANFAHAPATVADVDRDGDPEVVVTGNVYDCIPGYPSQYTGLYLFRPDRSRYVEPGADWSTGPVDTGAPLSEDYDLIESVHPDPVVADLDGDGELEMLFSSYDGRVHAFWLDGTEHGAWPFSVYPGAGPLRFASSPVVADLDRDGAAEVLFGSWTEKGSGSWGRLHVVSATGASLWQLELPAPIDASDWSGALASPTLAQIDDDPDLELVLQTAHAGVVAYELPGSAGAVVRWPTGRGNFRRAGGDLELLFANGFESGGLAAWSAAVEP